jgi:hypothetical protein
MRYEATAVAQARRARLEARLVRRRSREARRQARAVRAAIGGMGAASGTCYFVTCAEAASVEAIGTWDVVFGVERTVPLALCRRHADALRDELLLLDVA